MRRKPLLPKNTDAALLEVMNTVQRLQAVYEEENKVLHDVNPEAFLALQEKKIVAAQLYKDHMEEMIDRKDEIAKASPATKERLKAVQAEFHARSVENMHAIERMQRCTERLGNTIRNAAIRAAQSMRAYSYGEDGTIAGSARNKAVSSGLSETA